MKLIYAEHTWHMVYRALKYWLRQTTTKWVRINLKRVKNGACSTIRGNRPMWCLSQLFCRRQVWHATGTELHTHTVDQMYVLFRIRSLFVCLFVCFALNGPTRQGWRLPSTYDNQIRRWIRDNRLCHRSGFPLRCKVHFHTKIHPRDIWSILCAGDCGYEYKISICSHCIYMEIF